MSDIAVGERIVQLQIVDIESAVGERVPFVRIVVEVFRPDVVALEQKPAAQSSTCADRESTIKSFADAARHHYFAKIAKEHIAIDVQEAGQMYSLGVCKIDIDDEIARNLVLEPDIACVNSRVRIIAAVDAHTCKKRKLARRQHRWRDDTRPDRRAHAERDQV